MGSQEVWLRNVAQKLKPDKFLANKNIYSQVCGISVIILYVFEREKLGL